MHRSLVVYSYITRKKDQFSLYLSLIRSLLCDSGALLSGILRAACRLQGLPRLLEFARTVDTRGSVSHHLSVPIATGSNVAQRPGLPALGLLAESHRCTSRHRMCGFSVLSSACSPRVVNNFINSFITPRAAKLASAAVGAAGGCNRIAPSPARGGGREAGREK